MADPTDLPKIVNLVVEDVELLATLLVEDPVTVTIVGEINSIDVPETLPGSIETPSGNVSIRVTNQTIEKKSNLFVDLAEFEED